MSDKFNESVREQIELRNKRGALAPEQETPRSASVQGWQPIETAPKTSRGRLVWCPEIKCTFIVSWHDRTAEWLIFGGHGACLRYTPTHWMPLPDPPKTREVIHHAG